RGHVERQDPLDGGAVEVLADRLLAGVAGPDQAGGNPLVPPRPEGRLVTGEGLGEALGRVPAAEDRLLPRRPRGGRPGVVLGPAGEVAQAAAEVCQLALVLVDLEVGVVAEVHDLVAEEGLLALAVG